MVFSWQGFRDRYPQGAVISQLLGIHQDQFLVRVELRAEGAVLATALAADSQLEQAEDRARDRAWALLAAVPAGSSAPAAPQPTTVLPMKAAPAMPAKTTQPPPTPLKAAPSAANDDVPEEPDFEDDAPWPEEESPAALATAVATGPAAPQPSSPRPARMEPAPQTATAVAQNPQGSSQPAPQPASATATATAAAAETSPGVSAPLPPPVDLSDVIAQTEVELRRLGWTQAQGRDYLKQAYGKVSRHQLSDEELLEFLLHLEALPSPEAG
jgi:hypothetical protein